MASIEIAITALAFAAGVWAAWVVLCWAGEGQHRSTGPESEDWTCGDLPSRPYRELRRLW